MEEHAALRSHSWRWVILLSRASISFICLGCFKSLGVFLPRLVDSFSTDTAIVGFVCSLTLGFGLFTIGPFVGALINVWDARKLTIAGGTIAGIATLAATSSSSTTQLAVWFSLLSIGLAFVQVSSVKPLMDYFPDTFASANGVSLAGGTIGMMVLPPVMEYLVSVFGWRSALGLQGAFSLNYIVCGALFRPLRCSSVKYSQVASQPVIDTRTPASRKRLDDKLSNMNTDRGNVMTVFSKIWEFFRDRLDTQLLTEPVFIMYQVVIMLNGMVYSSWHIFLIPQGLELGYTDVLAVFLATFAGIGALIGRLSHGTVIDRGLTKASTLLVLASMVFAASCMLNPLALSSYVALAVLTTIAGVAIGAIYPLIYVLMREITGDRHMSAYSWLFLSHGVGQLLGGLFSGWIHIMTEAYEFVFIALGGLTVIMIVILVLTRCLESCCERND